MFANRNILPRHKRKQELFGFTLFLLTLCMVRIMFTTCPLLLRFVSDFHNNGWPNPTAVCMISFIALVPTNASRGRESGDEPVYCGLRRVWGGKDGDGQNHPEVRSYLVFDGAQIGRRAPSPVPLEKWVACLCTSVMVKMYARGFVRPADYCDCLF